MSLLRGLGSGGLLLLIVLGSPLLLVTVGRYPSGGWITLLQPDDGTVLLVAVTTLGWLMWAWFAISIVVEAGAQLSGRSLALPGFALPRAMTAGLIVSILALAAGTTSAFAEGTASHPAHDEINDAKVVAGTPLDVRSTPSTPEDRQPSGAPGSPLGVVEEIQDESTKTPSPPAAQAKTHTHVVSQGDDLWSLAEHYYGDGFAWRQIARANPDRLTGGPDVLEPGWRLKIPGVEPTEETTVEQVRVRPGDSLSAIAKSRLGSAGRWPELYATNRATIGDPDEITPGMVLKLPTQQSDQSVDPPSTPGEDTPVAKPRQPETQPERPTPRPPLRPDGGTSLGAPAGAEPSSGASRGAGTDPAPTPHAVQVPPREPGAPPRDATGSPQNPVVEPTATSPEEPNQLLGLTGLGALLAAGLMTGLAVRRRLQLAERPLGRRIIGETEHLARLEAAMGRGQDQPTTATLAAAQHAIYRHCLTLGEAVPRLDRAEVSAGEILFLFSHNPGFGPPPEFDVPQKTGLAPTCWRVRQHLEPEPETPSAYPGLVCLGSPRPGHHLFVDLATMPLLELDAVDPLLTGASTALMMELASSWWAPEVRVTLVGRPDDFVAAADLTSFGYVADPRRAIDGLLFRASERRRALASRTLAQAREQSPDAWTPEIYLFCGPIDAQQLIRLTELTVGDDCAMVAVAEGRTDNPIANRLHVTEGGWPAGPSATLYGANRPDEGLTFVPQLIDEPLRRSIVELFEATNSLATEDAPWWVGAKHLADGSPPSDVDSALPGEHSKPRLIISPSTPRRRTPLRDAEAEPAANVASPTAPITPGDARHDPDPDTKATATGPSPAHSAVEHEGPAPRVLLLGPLQLAHAAGVAPSRAERQCIEYGAWLLNHPGASARQMADALFVAESTRRSNMSRLRSWLGTDAEDQPYLPVAYSGRIRLAPAVDSDWVAFQRLVAAGIPRSGDSALVAALELVRGAPLADAAPGQWHWAEGLRIDIVSAVRDAAVVLARRAVRSGDVELARWSTGRGLAVAPHDELLLAARVETEYRDGNHREVERLASRITDHARELDVSLQDDTIRLLQEVVEGRQRTRRILA